MQPVIIKRLANAQCEKTISALSSILVECVKTGASVGFVQPFTSEHSSEFWQNKVFNRIESNQLILLIAYVGSEVAGCVYLDIDTASNQRHRADVSKLLVHPNFRGRGIATKLMQAIEEHALQFNRSLLVLDTKTGDRAESLYKSLGYEVAGIIPNFAQAPNCKGYDATTYMYKSLLAVQ